MNRRKLTSIVLTMGATVLLVLALVPGASAGALKAKILLVQAPIPKTLSEKGLIAFARRNAAKLLRESSDAEVKKRKWTADMVVLFNAPINDMEFQVLFYDVQDGPRRFVVDMTMMLNDRKQKTFVQKLVLPRPSFKPNRRMELVATVRRAEVGRVTFNVVGQEIQRSGEVSFSDSEAKGGSH